MSDHAHIHKLQRRDANEQMQYRKKQKHCNSGVVKNVIEPKSSQTETDGIDNLASSLVPWQIVLSAVHTIHVRSRTHTQTTKAKYTWTDAVTEETEKMQLWCRECQYYMQQMRYNYVQTYVWSKRRNRFNATLVSSETSSNLKATTVDGSDNLASSLLPWHIVLSITVRLQKSLINASPHTTADGQFYIVIANICCTYQKCQITQPYTN